MTAMAWDYTFDEVREKERDGVEVAIGPGFAATLENIPIASILARKEVRWVIETHCWILLFNRLSWKIQKLQSTIRCRHDAEKNVKDIDD